MRLKPLSLFLLFGLISTSLTSEVERKNVEIGVTAEIAERATGYLIDLPTFIVSLNHDIYYKNTTSESALKKESRPYTITRVNSSGTHLGLISGDRIDFSLSNILYGNDLKAWPLSNNRLKHNLEAHIHKEGSSSPVKSIILKASYASGGNKDSYTVDERNKFTVTLLSKVTESLTTLNGKPTDTYYGLANFYIKLSQS